jgi:type II secretory pathway component GspD/PulD (secretin)
LSKPSFLTESFGRKSLSVFLLFIVLVISIISNTATSQANGVADRQQAFRRIIQSYIQTGQEEYQRGFYEQAEKTFLMAQGYQQYLTAAGREHLAALIMQAQTAAANRKHALDAIQSANNLILQDKLIEAKAALETIRSNEFLTENEQAQISEVLQQINTQLIEDKEHSNKVEAGKLAAAEKLEKISQEAGKSQEKLSEQEKIESLFYHSMGFYRSGQLEKAREGFIEIINSESAPEEMKKTANSYLEKIDNQILQRAAQQRSLEGQTLKTMAVIEPEPDVNGFTPPPLEPEPEYIQPNIPSPALPEAGTTAPRNTSPVTGEGNYIERINRTRNILRSYTKTVVNDAIVKSNQYIYEGNFDKARQAIESADYVVNKNQIYLGEELYNEYKSRLRAASEEIDQKENEQTHLQEQERRENAIEAQRKFREQMEIERQKRITELMENALTYQKQGQYEAALGQLVNLLALDPQNNKALILKDTLEDTIYFRKQIEVQKEAEKQRAELLLKADQSQTPYPDELTYPKNWREIIEKPTRKPEQPIGLEPADANVYERLEKIVDLSDLTPGTSFGEVIDRLETLTTPPLEIQPNWRDLEENADIDQTTPAGLDPLTGVRLKGVLKLLLEGLSSDLAELDYVVEDGIIKIATVNTLTQPTVPTGRMVNRVYDITDLVGEPANYGGIQGMMMGRMMNVMGQQVTDSIYGGGTSGGYGGTSGGTSGGFGGGTSGGFGGSSGFGGGMTGGGMGGMGMSGMSGMGGMGMGGMGMSGMGMGGMGGGGYGGGGYGGGGYGGGGYGGGGAFGGGGGYIQAQSLIQLIEDTIEPDSWFDTSETGEGMITPYPIQSPKKLSIRQTHEVHVQIQQLLTALRSALGNQVSIEARYLVVTENFLEEIGLDVDFTFNLGGKWGQIVFEQNSAIAEAGRTEVPLSFGGIGQTAGEITGGYGSVLDDLQVAFLLKATQAHRDAESLTAPTVTVLSGESATFNIQRTIPFALPPIQQGGVTTVSGQAGTTTGVAGGLQPQYVFVPSGSALVITPVISHDKKNVLLQIITQQNEYLGTRESIVETPITSAVGESQVQTYTVNLPETESSTVMTRVSVPDSGTLLLGGQKITAQIETEAGVPILSKVPILGRLFSNRSKVRDQKILLILVKPTIILQEEREAEAIAAMESEI